MQAVKIFSGADGFDPDNSQGVVIQDVFVHSSDDAIAVKATMQQRDTVNVSLSHAVFSTKKSCLKVGTESRSNFNGISFSDVEGFNLDRGMVLCESPAAVAARVCPCLWPFHDLN